MAFTVYPDAATSALLETPINAPVPLAAGAAMGSFAPLAGARRPDPDAFNLQTTLFGSPCRARRSPRRRQGRAESRNPTAVTEGSGGGDRGDLDWCGPGAPGPEPT